MIKNDARKLAAVKRDEHPNKLREINQANSRFWNIQASLSEQYREQATTPEEALLAEKLAGRDTQHICSPKSAKSVSRRLHPKKSGRPRESASLALRVQELKNSHHKWNDIASILNKETGVHRSASAYRLLLKRQ